MYHVKCCALTFSFYLYLHSSPGANSPRRPLPILSRAAGPSRFATSCATPPPLRDTDDVLARSSGQADERATPSRGRLGRPPRAGP
jgi:hypothetical protein